MNDAKLQEYADQLNLLLKDIERQQDLGAEGQKTVILDQQSVGRLSRMDALQQQAMAQATAARRTAEATRIRAALARIDEGEFGFCADCGDEISHARLALNPAVALCLTCAKG